MTIAGRLASLASSLEVATMPVDVSEKALSCVLNAFGMAILGVELETARMGAEVARALSMGEGGGTTVLLDGSKAGRAVAIFANAALFHARAQDDTLGAGHFGTAVIPAVMAACATRGAEPDNIVPAIVAGYEVGGALESANGPASTARGFRSSAIHGPVAAAAALARLHRFDLKATEAAIATSASFAGGIVQSAMEGSDEWRYQIGMAGWGGTVASELAAAGSPFARTAFEGARGFSRAFVGRDYPELVPEGNWAIRRSEFKPYPVCAFNQSAVGALLKHRDHLDAGRIRRLEVRLDPVAAAYPGVANKHDFSSQTSTLLSLPFGAAVALIDGACSMRRLFDIGDPVVRTLADRVDIVADANLERNQVTIHAEFVDGASWQVAEGDPRNDAMSFDATEAMLRSIASDEGHDPAIIGLLRRGVEELQELGFDPLIAAFSEARAGIHPARMSP